MEERKDMRRKKTVSYGLFILTAIIMILIEAFLITPSVYNTMSAKIDEARATIADSMPTLSSAPLEDIHFRKETGVDDSYFFVWVGESEEVLIEDQATLLKLDRIGLRSDKAVEILVPILFVDVALFVISMVVCASLTQIDWHRRKRRTEDAVELCLMLDAKDRRRARVS
jgi:hypothetical protein